MYYVSVQLKEIPWSNYFFMSGVKLCKSNTTRSAGEESLCHPVVQGRYGETVLENVNVWVGKNENVQLAHVRLEDD